MENAIVEEMPREVREPPGASQGQPGAEAGEPGEPVRGRGAHKPARGGTRGNRREGPRGLHLASTPGPGGRAAGDWPVARGGPARGRAAGPPPCPGWCFSVGAGPSLATTWSSRGSSSCPCEWCGKGSGLCGRPGGRGAEGAGSSGPGGLTVLPGLSARSRCPRSLGRASPPRGASEDVRAASLPTSRRAH